MNKDYLKIVKYIQKCYENADFDLSVFQFYKTRKEKGQHRVGIINYQGKKFFFKIIKKEEYNDENVIKEKIGDTLHIVNKYYEYTFDNNIINLYECIDTININAFNFLRSNNYSYEYKKTELGNFFNHVINLMKNTYYKDKMDGSKRSDRWFWKRINQGGRATDYYGNNFELLLNDIEKCFPEFINNYNIFFKEIYNYLSSKPSTISAYSHGDFHDFNFALNGLFWDVETFGYNPILNDFVVYYWHFYGREDTLIYKYSPWLVNYMNNDLDKEELKAIRKLKEDMIKMWFVEIKKLFSKYNLDSNIYKEFVFKLFCRVFLIDNILNYEEEDKRKVYEYFNYFLINKGRNVEDLLFNNHIKF